MLDRSGFNEGRGAYLMNEGDNVLVIAPPGDTGSVGVVSVKPDGSTELLTVAPDPDAWLRTRVSW